ncbi:acyl-CoA dehydrogenase family protein [Pseudomonas nunensis]|uniref:Acyl-CoA/acyl-ACP dehydrogenase n=1 Tax=Pseudomonas nunensis TaxID=2961896 RepID=A0ABY5ENG5_9PSED|nr:acyl-CoA dehydrogenase family protein [Pseudomonas nunensis]KPN90832.1 acyl-CoA dehydrogenase [Pseudomonas nunensis]MCL5226547.1 acyl-CoA/acyl-ACP dehydrogenase [Pseudomonas nunensis]UTO17094.1 acyl-CoA/acyl-ACP dehydrogenase [Pseudomonas nunensis]
MDLQTFLQQQSTDCADTQALGRCLRALVEAGLDQLPLPGSGETLERFQRLAEVGGHDLGLCKLYEGHTDALAIIQQLGGSPTPASTWGMWAAEPPQAKVRVSPSGHMVLLNGRKAWCSGAAVLSHALLTAWDDQDRQQLVAVALDQPGVNVTADGWHAVGMGATGSVEVLFEGAEAQAIGNPGDYLQRPGFWQGGIGIAACWYGAAQSIAERLRRHCAQRPESHALAHLGAVDSALHAAAQVLRVSAMTIDTTPLEDAELLARRARAVVEHSAELVIQHVGHALGAGPYCKDRQFARLIADLPVFLRQSHAERDLAALGEQVVNGGWTL